MVLRIITFCIILLNLSFSYRKIVYAQETIQDLVLPKIELELNNHDRVLILAPHPDDEVLGCGGIIQRLVRMGIPLKIVFLTYGDNNQWSFLVYRKHPVIKAKAVQKMGEIRRSESIKSGKILGVSSDQMIFLGYPDFRTLTIWCSHWADQPAARGMFSRAKAVPYSDAFRPGALYKGEEIVKDLKSIFCEFRPTKIFLSHPADHNPDHRALYLFTRIALWELEEEMRPKLYPYLIHFKKWPQPKGYKPNKQIMPPDLLKKEISWRVINLTPEEVENKRRAIIEHHSQYISSPKYLLSFVRANELFGDFPVISLKEKSSRSTISHRSQEYLTELPEELIEEEKIEFVGIEEEFLYLQEKTLIFTLRLSRPISSKINVSLYVFGYRKDSPFSDMPKLHIMFKKKAYYVYDQGKIIQCNELELDRKPNEITIHIPLKVLKHPERILTSVRSYRGQVPLDWVEWRIIEVDSCEK